MYLLLVDDDPRLTRLLNRMLLHAGHTVDVAQDGALAWAFIRDSRHDVLILDWMLPRESGVSLCRRAREKGYSGGVLMLTARDSLEDRLEGFGAGADDYLVKPFEPAELLARIDALGRRVHQPLRVEQLSVGPWRLDCGERALAHRDGGVVALTQREFQLLELLMREAGRGVSRDVIFERIWGRDLDVTDNALDATLRLLRKKLARLDAEAGPIETLRGMGYRFAI